MVRGKARAQVWFGVLSTISHSQFLRLGASQAVSQLSGCWLKAYRSRSLTLFCSVSFSSHNLFLLETLLRQYKHLQFKKIYMQSLKTAQSTPQKPGNLPPILCMSLCYYSGSMVQWVVLRKFFLNFFSLSVKSCKVVVKVRDDKYSRAAGRALLIGSSYLSWQQSLIETRLGVRSPKSTILLFCDLGHVRHFLQIDQVISKDFSALIFVLLKMKVMFKKINWTELYEVRSERPLSFPIQYIPKVILVTTLYAFPFLCILNIYRYM